jgi:glutamate/tyrosine decarboxylase-like PLP-dependent enzyme
MDTLSYMEGYGALVEEAVAQREELEQARAKLRDLELVNAWLLDEVAAQCRLREAAEAPLRGAGP